MVSIYNNLYIYLFQLNFVYIHCNFVHFLSKILSKMCPFFVQNLSILESEKFLKISEINIMNKQFIKLDFSNLLNHFYPFYKVKNF